MARTIFAFASALCLMLPAALPAADRPNILWLTTEDIGPELGCYGDPYADTPQLDAFARRSCRFLNAWSNAPVCAPARTTIISGVEPTCLGAEHMRSLVSIPGFMKLYPQLMREQGYFCANPGKTDYNIIPNGQVWDDVKKQNPWPQLKSHQPFMAVFNYVGTHESQIRKRPHQAVHDPAQAIVPPYHPDTPTVRTDWAQYYDNITEMDEWFGRQIRQLQAQGLEDNTIVFFYGDHGSGMPRHKRNLNQSGLHVALLVYVPERFYHLLPQDVPAQGTASRLVSFVDLTATLLSLIDQKPPEWVQGTAFLGTQAGPPARYQYGFRGRMDERFDLSRTVRNERFHYIRHYMPHRLAGTHLAYMFETPTTREWHQLFLEGKLNAVQSVFWEPKASEELFDLQSDPDEIKNLVASPEHQTVLAELRQAHLDHVLTIRDVGFLPEDELHHRAPGKSPYELGHDPTLPLEEIVRMAHVASLRLPDAQADLHAGLMHGDSAVRYWAAMGYLQRGTAAVQSEDALLKALVLNDPSPSVRTVAAEALGRYGLVEDLPAVLAWLLEAANGEKHGPYLSIAGLEALDALDEKALPVIDQIRELPRKGDWESPRNSNYADRLIDQILAELEPAKPGTSGQK